MKKYLFFILILVAVCTSCQQDKHIPKEEMASIMYDCFLTDRCLEDSFEFRAQADTTVVYLPVIEKHGYTKEEFLESLQYWLTKPADMKEIYNLARTKMKNRRAELQTEMGQEDEIAIKEMKASKEVQEQEMEAAMDEERLLQEKREDAQRRASFRQSREKKLRDKKNKRDVIINQEGAPIVETPSN